MSDSQVFDGTGEVQTFDKEINRSEYKKVKRKLRYLSKFHFVYYCTVIFLIFVSYAIYYYSLHNDKYLDAETFSFRISGGLFVALAVGVGIIAIAYAICPTKLFDSKKLSSIFFGTPQKSKKIIFDVCYSAINILAIIFLLININSVYRMFDFFYVSIQSPNDVIFSYISIVILISFIIANIINRVINKKSAKVLHAYGEKLDQIINDDFESRKIKPFDLRQLFAFRAYNKKSLIRVISVALVYVMTIIFVFCLAAFIQPSPFNRRMIEKVDIGYSIGYVYRMFGEPHERSETIMRGESGSEVVYGTWKWCSSKLAKQIADKTEQLEKLSELENLSEENFEKMAKLTEQIFNLELELSMTKCDYITVNFRYGKVTHVEFKNDYSEVDAREVSATRILYSVVFDRNMQDYTAYSEIPTVWYGDKVKEVDLKMYLSDGSMVIKTITFVTPITKDNPTAQWRDEYGEHTFEIKFD